MTKLTIELLGGLSSWAILRSWTDARYPDYIIKRPDNNEFLLFNGGDLNYFDYTPHSLTRLNNLEIVNSDKLKKEIMNIYEDWSGLDFGSYVDIDELYQELYDEEH